MTSFYCASPDGLNLNPVPFLAPWEKIFEDPASINVGMFQAWQHKGRSIYNRLTEPGDVDFHLLFSHWRECNQSAAGALFARQQIDVARAHKKKILIWCEGDETEKIDWPLNAIVFRPAISRSSRHECEIAPPLHHRDIFTEGREVIEGVESKIALGFCGYAPPLNTPWGVQRIKDSIKFLTYASGLGNSEKLGQSLRAHVLFTLGRQSEIETNFLLRRHFAFNKWGVLQPGGSALAADAQRKEFLQNMASSEFALCVRGIANCSIRLFEAMCLGRIPVVIDTDSVFPADSVIPWEKSCIVVKEADVRKVPERILEYCANNSKEMRSVQARLNREIWIEYLSAEGYFENLVKVARISS